MIGELSGPKAPFRISFSEVSTLPVFTALRHVVACYGIPETYARDLIAGLRVPACVASNGSLDEIRTRLRIARLDRFFGDRLWSASDLGAPKPAPDVYLAAARAMGEPSRACVVIEDSVIGVTAAARAGMPVYGFAGRCEPESLRGAGATVFATMPDIARELKAITRR